jgi:hypothetical protein
MGEPRPGLARVLSGLLAEGSPARAEPGGWVVGAGAEAGAAKRQPEPGPRPGATPPPPREGRPGATPPPRARLGRPHLLQSAVSLPKAHLLVDLKQPAAPLPLRRAEDLNILGVPTAARRGVVAVPKGARLAGAELPVSRVRLDYVRTLRAAPVPGPVTAVATATLLPADSSPAVVAETATGDEPSAGAEPAVVGEPPGGREPRVAAELDPAIESLAGPDPVPSFPSQALSQLTQAMLRSLAAQAREGSRGPGLSRPAGLSSAAAAPAVRATAAKGEVPVSRNSPSEAKPGRTNGPQSNEGQLGELSLVEAEAPGTTKAPTAAVARALSLLAASDGGPQGRGQPAASDSPREASTEGTAPQSLEQAENQAPEVQLPARDPRADDILPARKRGLNLRLRLR